MINRQKHKTTCGIVAAHNALEFVGMKKSYKGLMKVVERKYSFRFTDHGMNFTKVLALLKSYKVRLKVDAYPTFASIEKAIDEGKAVLFLYRWSIDGMNKGHFMFITGYTKKFFIAYNDSRKNKTPYRSKKVLAQHIRYSYRWKGDKYPYAIVVG